MLNDKRLLSIDPCGEGFGYAIFEGPEKLLDWGLKAGSDNRECLRKAARLIRRYRPEVLVVEDTDARGCRRRPRAIRLIRSLLTLAASRSLLTRRISHRFVRSCFTEGEEPVKSEIALALVQRFPELGPYYSLRKRGEGEDRLAIFDAAAFAYACYARSLKSLLPLSHDDA